MPIFAKGAVEALGEVVGVDVGMKALPVHM